MVSSLFWRYKMKKIRELRADEIEVRVGVVRLNGCVQFVERKQEGVQGQVDQCLVDVREITANLIDG